jgi:hypothetical protein
MVGLVKRGLHRVDVLRQMLYGMKAHFGNRQVGEV